MISIIFPTRNRPQNLHRLAKSLFETSSVMPEIVVYIDDDDKMSLAAAEQMEFKWIQGPRQLLSQCYNEAAAQATGDLLMYAGDDIIFKTPNWDVMVEKEFDRYEDRILVVHGDDLSHGRALHATHGVLHRRWVDILGYFVPPYFGPWFDNWITDVANALNRRSYIPFVNEHLHWTSGKAQFDKTYQDAIAKQEIDTEKYKETLPQRLQDIEKLRSKMIN